jgi:pimeloyl-ACP methyl ester carboxylesterase
VVLRGLVEGCDLMSSLEPARVPDPIGHELVGTGPARAVIMNDWLCDTSTWAGARAFLDGARFTFAFADLRGHGRSRGRAGKFTLDESAADVLALADALGWARFAAVGHSMSALIALCLAQHHADRIERVVALAPPCDQLVVAPLADSGHYPMQEMPPLTVALIEGFLGR